MIKKEDKNWYALYIKSRAEKKTHTLISGLGYESYLPIIKVLRQWSDRKKMVEAPLLPSYIFVCITEEQLRDIITLPGVVTYVRHEGKAAIIPDKQIETLKNFINNGSNIETYTEDISPGDKINITSGPLTGLKGECVKIKGKNRIIIRFETLGSVISAEIPAGSFEKAPKSPKGT